MRGTRYGDFSRLHTRDGDSSVLMQQGRVQLDADFNAQAELGDRRLAGALADLLGRSGAPASAPGFEIRPQIALELDRDSAAFVMGSPALAPDPEDVFTVETWVDWRGGPALLVGWSGDGGELVVEVDERGMVTARRRREDFEWDLVAAGERLPRRRFVHVALSWGREHAELSIDGVRAGRARVGPGLPIARGELVVARGLLGLLGGVRAWGSTEPGEDEDMIAWWPFDEGRGDRAHDVLGGPDARVESAGLPHWHLVDLEAQPGRYYVDGVACELTEPLRYRRQPALPGAELPDRRGTHLVYLEVWEQSVSAIEDASLREVALGGLDTAVRSRTAYALRTVPVPSERPADADALLAEVLADRQPTGRMRAEHRGEALPGNYLYRVEIHRSGDPEEDEPTFKWSRRNGAETVAVAPVEPDSRRIELLPGDGAPPPFGHGDAIELLDATVGLDGPVRPLLWVDRVEGQDDVVVLSDPVPHGVGADPDAGPFVRRWDQRRGDEEIEGGAVRLRADRWVELEDGIRVQFAPGTYRRGDYWWVVARQDLGGIDWPREDGRPAARPPEGVERRRAPLALLRLADGEVEALDVRGRIEALVAPPSPLLPLRVVMPEPAEDAGVEEPRRLPSPPEPQPHPAAPAGGLPAGLAVVGPAGAAPPGFASTGVELATRRRWRLMARCDGDVAAVQGLAATADGLVLATTRELVAIDRDWDAHVIAELPADRHGFACCAVDGRVFLVGGGPAGRGPDGAVLAFDLDAGTWEPARSLPRAVHAPAVAVIAGRVHVVGGTARHLLFRRPRRDHWVYDAAEDGWSAAAPLPVASTAAAAGSVDGCLHVVGGMGGGWFGGERLHRHDVFDPADGAWRSAPAAPRGGPMRAGAGSGGELLVVTDSHDGPRVLGYERESRRWEELEAVPGDGPAPVLAAAGDGPFVLAAGEGGELDLRELPARRRWTLLVAEEPA